MTIAKRLIILVAVPLVALLGVGFSIRMELSKVEAKSRFVAESRITALAMLGNMSMSFAELRVDLRNYLMATTPEQKAAARSAFDEDERDVLSRLQQYEERLVVGTRGNRLLNETRDLNREYISVATQ